MEVVEKVDDQVTLKTGRKVKVKEVSALEELLAWQIAGEKMDRDNEIGAGVLFRKVSVVLALEKIDGNPVVTPTDLGQVCTLLAQFKKKEWSEIEKLYDAANGDSDELPGE